MSLRILDGIIAEKVHGWEWHQVTENRKILVPPINDHRSTWAAMWDENGFPHWLPEYRHEAIGIRFDSTYESGRVTGFDEDGDIFVEIFLKSTGQTYTELWFKESLLNRELLR